MSQVEHWPADQRPGAPHQHGTGDHDHQHDYRQASRRNLTLALGITASFMVAEIVGGVWSNSLALLADAGHMVTDSAALGLALLAIWIGSRPASIKRTFGFQRTEILAALANAVSLWAIAAWIWFEAYQRLMDPPQVQGGIMLAVGLAGLVANLAVAGVLHHSAGFSLNVEGAFLHVLGDLLGSVAVVVSSLLILAFGWTIADPIFGAFIGLLILISSGRLLWKVLQVLMEGTPVHVDLHQLCQRLEQVEGVTGVHDIHAWTITTGYEALSAHVTATDSARATPDQTLQVLRNIASREFGIGHVTIQLEASPEGCEESHHIQHPEPPKATPNAQPII
jgi:cobalt-zinc-cadmium efflux system protein